MNPIEIAKTLSLPKDAATQTFAFIGRKGSGKTYAAGLLVEQLLAADVQTIVLDPVGTWYGLRIDRGGKRKSQFALPILGGQHGDIGLEQHGGPLVASFVCQTGSSCVLDVSSFRKNQRKAFVADFAETLFHAKKSQRSPMHLVIEEAQLFAPQMSKGQERMVGAIEDIVRLGRNYGIGSSMISQRPQSVNKEILNQAEPLVVFQLVGKHERDAVRGWIVENADELRDAAAELPTLKTGECYFWSPAWLRTFKKVQIGRKVTFDASATPAAGVASSTPAKLAPVDLGALSDAMRESIERAEAEDPKALRAKIAELKRQLADQPDAAEAIERALLERDRHWQAQLRQLEQSYDSLVSRLARISDLASVNGHTPEVSQPPKSSATQKGSDSVIAPTRSAPVAPVSTPLTDNPLGKAEARILRAFYWLTCEEATRSKVAFYSGYRAGSGSFNNALGKLRRSGLIEGWQITASGEETAAGFAEPKPTGPQLREWLRPKLGKAENALLDALLERYPDRLSNEALSAATGYAAGSGSFNNALGRLRSLEAAEGSARSGGTRAADIFAD